MKMLDECAVSYRVVLTKADKSKSAETQLMQADIEAILKTHPAAFPEPILTSSHEGNGIGRRLMELQHQHLAENGYHLVKTGTRNQFKRMLILNLLNGFELVGVRHKNGGPHLMLEKRLIPVAKSPEKNPGPL